MAEVTDSIVFQDGNTTPPKDTGPSGKADENGLGDKFATKERTASVESPPEPLNHERAEAHLREGGDVAGLRERGYARRAKAKSGNRSSEPLLILQLIHHTGSPQQSHSDRRANLPQLPAQRP